MSKPARPLLAAVLLLVASACGASDDATAASTEAAGATAPTTTTTAATTASGPATTTTTTEATTTTTEVQYEYPYDFAVIDGITVLEPSDWDTRFTATPNVYVQEDGTWLMFYSGSGGRTGPTGMGLATSTDGITWEKQAVDGPFFQREDRQPFGWVFVHPDGDGWVMYYTLGFSVGFRDVYRASAPAPEGPWEEEGLAFFAPGDEWNHRIVPSGLTKIGDTWWMPYGGFARGGTTPSVGFMTSTDGVEWVSSGPVYSGSGSDWDAFGVMPSNILDTDHGLEIFFLGFERLPLVDHPAEAPTFKMGRLVSTDGGQTWVPDNDGQPILDTGERGWPGIAVVEQDGTYFVYGGHELGGDGIFLSMGTIPRP
jgi:hypothetical protein